MRARVKLQVDRESLAQRADALYDHLGSISRASFMVSTIWALALRLHISSWTLGGWWSVSVLVAIGRLTLLLRYRRSRSQRNWSRHNAAVWIRRYTLGAAVSGTVWGATVLLLWVPGSFENQIIMTLIFGGLTAGATSTLPVHRAPFFAWLIPALFPLILRCAIEGGWYLFLGAVSFAFTVAMLLVAGKTYSVHSNSFRLHSEKSQLIERLRAEEQALRDSNQALEERVEERTEALRIAQREKEQAELELRHAQKLEALGQLTGGIAHDFNNLLTVIVGSLDGIDASGELSSRSTVFTQNALRAAERGARLTHSLLAFSRKQLLQPTVIELPAMLRELSDSLLNSALGARIRLKFELPDNLWAVLVDPDRLQTALLNLCVNARHAMAQGGTITLRASNLTVARSTASFGATLLDAVSTDAVSTDAVSTDAVSMSTSRLAVTNGEYVQLEVQDSGNGISPDQLERVFEPFFTTKRDGAGSGLGLSMVYGFCQQSGGHVRIDSTVGVGTTVTLLLPLTTSMRAAKAKKYVPLTQLPRGEGQTVLVVEDEPVVRELAAQMLTLLGYKVSIAANAAEALELLRDPQFCVTYLFSDVTMPGELDGFDLARQAKKLRPNVAIVLTSGFHGKHSEVSSLNNWTQLPKPYGVQDLAHALANTAG